MSREEFLLNLLNVLTPTINVMSPKTDAHYAAEGLYIELINDISEHLFPTEETSEPIDNSRIEYMDLGFNTQDNTKLAGPSETVDVWEKTLKDSIELLHNQLEEYQSKK